MKKRFLRAMRWQVQDNKEVFSVCFVSVYHLHLPVHGGSRGGPPSPYFGQKKKKQQKEEKTTGQANKQTIPPPHPTPPLAQGLDPPLSSFIRNQNPDLS